MTPPVCGTYKKRVRCPIKEHEEQDVGPQTNTTDLAIILHLSDLFLEEACDSVEVKRVCNTVLSW